MRTGVWRMSCAFNSNTLVDRPGDGGRARHAGTLFSQPGFQFGEKKRTLLLADTQTLIGGKAVDAALDVEQHVNTPDRLQCDRRDRRRVLAAPRIGGDVGQLEELPPGMGPAQRGRDRSRSARGIVKRVITAIGIGLQDTGVALKMSNGMLVPPVAGGVIQRRRRRMS